MLFNEKSSTHFISNTVKTLNHTHLAKLKGKQFVCKGYSIDVAPVCPVVEPSWLQGNRPVHQLVALQYC